jgi:hypothetical protein
MSRNKSSHSRTVARGVAMSVPRVVGYEVGSREQVGFDVWVGVYAGVDYGNRDSCSLAYFVSFENIEEWQVPLMCSCLAGFIIASVNLPLDRRDRLVLPALRLAIKLSSGQADGGAGVDWSLLVWRSNHGAYSTVYLPWMVGIPMAWVVPGRSIVVAWGLRHRRASDRGDCRPSANG